MTYSTYGPDTQLRFTILWYDLRSSLADEHLSQQSACRIRFSVVILFCLTTNQRSRLLVSFEGRTVHRPTCAGSTS